jgi:hypothetical protein
MTTRLRGIGAPVRLPLRVAVQVAWTSIRVRLARSLVTVSSVVLAVAFLLTVLGGDVVTRAVWSAHDGATRAARDTAALREALERPRSDMIGLQASGHAVAADAVALVAWIEALKPSQIYLLCRTATPLAVATGLDAPQAVEHMTTTVAGFRGVRLPWDDTRLRALAAAAPELRAIVAQARTAESARLAQVAAGGGPRVVMDRLADGARAEELAAVGLPITAVLDRAEIDLAALAAQARTDRIRLTAQEALASWQRTDPSLLRAEDVRDWPGLQAHLRGMLPADLNLAVPRIGVKHTHPAERLLRMSPRVAAAVLAPAADSDRLRQALNSSLASPEWYIAADFAAFDVRVPAEADALGRLNLSRLAERRLTRLNRILLEALTGDRIAQRPAVPALDLDRIADGTLERHPGAAEARTSVTMAIAAVGGDLPSLRADLLRRADAAVLGRTFAEQGFDPDDAGERTFWLLVLSLLVCIVGIVNTMTMAVTERFREIATMKCLGALDAFILKAFLIESSAMGLAGAVLGAGIGLVLVTAQAVLIYGGAVADAFPAGGLATATGTAVACGLGLAVLGALLPALQAARMAPIEAMRVDL